MGTAAEMGGWMLGGGDPQSLIVTYTGTPDQGTLNAGVLQVIKVSLPGLSTTASHGMGSSWDQDYLKTNMHEGAFNVFVGMSDVALSGCSTWPRDASNKVLASSITAPICRRMPAISQRSSCTYISTTDTIFSRRWRTSCAAHLRGFADWRFRR